MARVTTGTHTIPALLRHLWGTFKPEDNSLDSLIQSLMEMRTRMGNLPVVIQDTLGDFGCVQAPFTQEMQFWDIADHNLPPLTEEPPEPKEKGYPFTLGRRVVVIKRAKP